MSSADLTSPSVSWCCLVLVQSDKNPVIPLRATLVHMPKDLGSMHSFEDRDPYIFKVYTSLQPIRCIRHFNPFAHAGPVCVSCVCEQKVVLPYALSGGDFSGASGPIQDKESVMTEMQAWGLKNSLPSKQRRRY